MINKNKYILPTLILFFSSSIKINLFIQMTLLNSWYKTVIKDGRVNYPSARYGYFCDELSNNYRIINLEYPKRALILYRNSKGQNLETKKSLSSKCQFCNEKSFSEWKNNWKFLRHIKGLWSELFVLSATSNIFS